MHDIKTIRDDPAAFDDGLKRRGAEPLAQELLALDAQAPRGADAPRRAAAAPQRRLQGDRRRQGQEAGRRRREADGRGARRSRTRSPAVEAEEKETAAALDCEAGRDPEHSGGGCSRRPRHEREQADPRLGRAARLRLQAEGAFRPRRDARADGFRARRETVGRALHGPDREAGAARAGARPVHARHPHARVRLHGSQPAAAGARRGDVRHRPAAEIRRRPVPHHQRPLARADRRSAADQSRRRRDRRRGEPAAALHRADRLLPRRGGGGGQGHARHAAPAPVLQGRAGLGRRTRTSRRTSTSA